MHLAFGVCVCVCVCVCGCGCVCVGVIIKEGQNFGIWFIDL